MKQQSIFIWVCSFKVSHGKWKISFLLQGHFRAVCFFEFRCFQMLWLSRGHSFSSTSDMDVYVHEFSISNTCAVPSDRKCPVHQHKEKRETQTLRIMGLFALCSCGGRSEWPDLWWQQWHTWVTICSTTLLKQSSGQSEFYRRWSLPLLTKVHNCNHLISIF